MKLSSGKNPFVSLQVQPGKVWENRKEIERKTTELFLLSTIMQFREIAKMSLKHNRSEFRLGMKKGEV